MHKHTINKPPHGSLEWQHVRWRDENNKCVVGASEVSTIMGCNPYESVAEMAVRKMLPPQVSETNDAMTRGNVLEPALITHASNALGINLITPDIMYRNGRFIATLDAEAIDDPTLLVEAKTNNHWAFGSELPDSWFWQAQAQMHCTGADKVTFVILDRHMRLGFELVERSDDAIARMEEAVEAFCLCVDEERMPADAVLTAPLVTELYKDAKGEVELEGNILYLLGEWEAAKHAIKEAEERERNTKDEIARMLLDKEFGTVCGTRVVSFKTQSSSRLDSKALLADHPELKDAYTKTTTTRVMRIIK
jgi:putative phage-type endonuclease